MTETEVEYDANERDSWYAQQEYDEAICPMCGNLRAICSNPEGLHGEGFYPQRYECLVKAAEDRSSRIFKKLHEKDVPDADGFLPTDGIRIHVSLDDLTPDDDFLNERSLSDPPHPVP